MEIEVGVRKESDGVGDMVFTVVVGLVVAKLLAELILAGLNRAEVRRHRAQAPAAVAAIMDADTYRKSVDYTLAKNRFGVWSMIFDTGVLLLALSSPVLPDLFGDVGAWSPAGKWDDALFILLAGVLLSIPSLPFDWWGQFRLEERFGFNKSTPGLWISDKFKGLALTLVIGLPLLWALL
jgi:STE24 endopeptidase